jgi:hypothetical protein
MFKINVTSGHFESYLCKVSGVTFAPAATVRYHSGGSMKLNACILFLAHMVYL